MSIPALREHGWLPKGHHPATWEQIADRFGGEPGSRRAAIFSGLLRWRDAVRGKQMNGRLILNGSFISAKAEPGDFDVLFVYDNASANIIAQDAKALRLLDSAHCKALYGGDVWAFSEQAVRDFPQFCRVDGFDREKETRRLKGVLEVNL